LVTGLDPTSQKNRRSIIEECLREPLKPDSKLIMRDVPLRDFDSSHVRLLRDRKRDLPGAANNRKKYLSAMFRWAIENAAEETGVKSNPCRDVKSAKYASDGFHTWTVDEVEQYRAHHVLGSKARLALELLLLLGVRKEDVVVLGRQHLKPVGTLRGGTIRMVPLKTEYLGGARLQASEKPILDPLADVMEASREVVGDLAFLVTEYRKPFTANGFGNKMRTWCDEAGLPHCTAHGLRKAGASIAAVNGATLPQLMAIFDWSTPDQAMVYIEKANKDRMTRDAMRPS
jgi:integrase